MVRSDPDKNWKFSRADIEERERWKDYQRAYEACLTATSTKIAPWYVVPADDKENARLIISQVILRHSRRIEDELPKTRQGPPEGIAVHPQAFRKVTSAKGPA